MRLENLVLLLRAANLGVTALVSLSLVYQGLGYFDYPLVAMGLLSFFLSIVLFFHPTPRGFAFGLYLGGLVAPLLAFQFYFGYFELSPIAYLAFTAIMALPLFPKVLSMKFVILKRLHVLSLLFFALGVLVVVSLEGLSFSPLFELAFLIGLGIALATTVEEKSSVSIVSRVALPFLASQLYLSALIFVLTHLGFAFNPLLLLNGVLQESWLYFPASVFLLASSILATNKKMARLLPEAMISVNLAGLISSALLLVSPIYSLAFTIPALAGSTNEVERNEMLAYAIRSFVRDDRESYKDATILHYKLGYEDELGCALLSAGLCDKAIWVSDNYGADLLKCDRDALVKCLNVYGYVPKRVDYYIMGLASERPIEAYNLAEKYAVVPEVRDSLPRLRAKALEALRTKWDPRAWIGSNLNGYKIVGYIGRGSSMYVMKAFKDGKAYAVKIPILDDALARVSYQDLISEINQLRELNAKLNSVVKIVDFRQNDEALIKALQGDFEPYLTDPPYLVVELMEGGTAQDLVMDDNLYYSDEWEEIVKEIVLDVARILWEFHDRGWIHLDVKPSNILFDKKPGKTGKEVLESLRSGAVKVKLSDVASARKFWERAHHFTPEFSSVEQVEVVLGFGNVYPGLDVFSLGATAYFMMTRTMPLAQLKRLYDAALSEAEAGRREKALEYLEEAKREYVRIYESLSFDSFEDKRFADLVKRMMHPDPKLRPNVWDIVKQFEKMKVRGP